MVPRPFVHERKRPSLRTDQWLRVPVASLPPKWANRGKALYRAFVGIGVPMQRRGRRVPARRAPRRPLVRDWVRRRLPLRSQFLVGTRALHQRRLHSPLSPNLTRDPAAADANPRPDTASASSKPSPRLALVIRTDGTANPWYDGTGVPQPTSLASDERIASINATASSGCGEVIRLPSTTAGAITQVAPAASASGCTARSGY